jgi:hypothetical protein
MSANSGHGRAFPKLKSVPRANGFTSLSTFRSHSLRQRYQKSLKMSDIEPDDPKYRIGNAPSLLAENSRC